MLKKAIAFVFAVCALLPHAPALAATPAQVLSASVSKSECGYGETVNVVVRTTKSTQAVSLLIDGEEKAQAKQFYAANGYKLWQADAVMDKLGERQIEFSLRAGKGELFSSSTLLNVTVMPAPQTLEPLMISSRSAVLMAVQAPDCGITHKASGFFMGTSPYVLDTHIKSSKILRGNMHALVTELEPNTRYYYQAYVETRLGISRGDIASFTMPETKEYTAEDAMIADMDDRYLYLFGTTDRFYTKHNPPYGFATSREAQKHMETITVPVWKLSGRKKVESKMQLTIHKKLAGSAAVIFDEIFELPEKFPIMMLKGFSYRTVRGPDLYTSSLLSHHSFGAAIDINRPHNLFYRYKDRRNANNPYYIPESVIEVFEKHGWYWGGDFKEGLDTMHFQYLGLDLTPPNEAE